MCRRSTRRQKPEMGLRKRHPHPAHPNMPISADEGMLKRQPQLGINYAARVKIRTELSQGPDGAAEAPAPSSATALRLWCDYGWPYCVAGSCKRREKALAFLFRSKAHPRSPRQPVATFVLNQRSGGRPRRVCASTLLWRCDSPKPVFIPRPPLWRW